MNSDSKTLTRSFRIDKETFDALREDAERKRITVNTLVNQLFLTHSEFERYFERMGIVKISAALFGLLLAAAPEKEIMDTGRMAGKDIPKTIIIAKNGILSLKTVVSFLKMMSEYANLFEYNEVDADDGTKVITLMHRFGRNGTLFLVEYSKAIFGEIGIEPRVAYTEHSVVLEVKSWL